MGKEKIKPVYSYDTLGKSPFIGNLSIPATLLPISEYIEDRDGDMMPKEVWVERTPFVRLYIISEHRKFTNNLSDKATCLFLWILFEMEHGHDYLWVDKNRYMSERGIKSYNTYINASKELVRYCFLAYTPVKDVFWVNPNFAYRGNRVKRFRDNVVKIGG